MDRVLQKNLFEKPHNFKKMRVFFGGYCSARYSTTPGHAAMGVYITPTGSKIIVVGIYGPSINSDVESLAYYQEVQETLNELSNTFQTTSIIMAGDFNAILSENDTSSFHKTKGEHQNICKR